MCCRACAPRHRPRPSHTCWRAAEHGRRAARHPCAPLCSPCCCASTLCIGPHQPRCRAALMYTLVGGQTRCPCCCFLAATLPLLHLPWHARSFCPCTVPLHPLPPHASTSSNTLLFHAIIAPLMYVLYLAAFSCLPVVVASLVCMPATATPSSPLASTACLVTPAARAVIGCSANG